MLKYRPALLIIFGLTLMAWIDRSYAETSATVAFDAATFFPLRSGDVYTYRESKLKEGTTTIIQKLIGHPRSPQSNAPAVIPIREVDAEGVTGEIAYFSSDSINGLLNQGEEDVETGCTEALMPPLTIPNGLTVGDTISQSMRLMIKGSSQDCLPATSAAYTVTFESVETVTVPAGTFAGSIKLLVHEIWRDAGGNVLSDGSTELFLAPNIGLVKEVTIKDQEVAELVSFEAQHADANAGNDTFSNDLSVGIDASRTLSKDDTVQGYTLTIPYLNHSFEYALRENLLLTVDSQVDFTLDNVAANADTSNALNIQTEPGVQWDVTNTISLTESFPANFSNATSGESGATRENSAALAARTEVAYATLEEDLHGLSSWDTFAHGLRVAGYYEQQLYNHAAGSETAPEGSGTTDPEAGGESDSLDSSVGIDLEYAYFHEPLAWMVTPALSLVKHLNQDVDESLTIDASVTTFKDFNTFLTGGLTLGVNSLKPDAASELTSELHLGLDVNVSAFENVDVTTALDYYHDVSESGADPVYTISFGVEYDIFGSLSHGRGHESRSREREGGGEGAD